MPPLKNYDMNSAPVFSLVMDYALLYFLFDFYSFNLLTTEKGAEQKSKAEILPNLMKIIILYIPETQ